MLFSLIDRHRARRRLVLDDAADLITSMGDAGYDEARSRARARRQAGDSTGDRHWTRVAVTIARQTGIRVGEKVADRYAVSARGPRSSAVPHGVAEALVDIAEAIRVITQGAHDRTTVHNACARGFQIAEGRAGALSAAKALCQALAELSVSGEANAGALKVGIYPFAAEAAGEALQRLREALVKLIRPDLVERCGTILAALEAAKSVAEMDQPTFTLHSLKGDRAGYWSVKVRANWRVVFTFERDTANDVDLDDYHTGHH